MVTELSPELFLEEIKRWGFRKDSLIRVRTMLKNDFYFCKLHTPYGETLQTRIKWKEYNDFYAMVISPISVPAIWDEAISMPKLEVKN